MKEPFELHNDLGKVVFPAIILFASDGGTIHTYLSPEPGYERS